MSRTWWRRGRSTLVMATALGLAMTACYYTVGPDTGQLDPTFGGGDGAVVDDAVERFTAVAPLPDGDLLVAGESGDGLVAGRYDADGTPDATSPPAPLLPDRIDEAHRVVDVAVDGSGAAVLLVQHGLEPPVNTWGGGPFGWSIVKLRPDGAVDTAFGEAGLAGAGPASAYPQSIGVRPDGSILVEDVEVSTPVPPATPASFERGVRTLSAAGEAVGRTALATWLDTAPRPSPGSMAIGPAGEAYVVSAGLHRLDPDGTHIGPVSPPPFPGTSPGSNLLEVAVDGAGRVVARGFMVHPDHRWGKVIVRFDAALAIDTTFGDAGRVLLPHTDGPAPDQGLYATDDGTVTFVELRKWQSSPVTIRRFTPTGAPDTSMSGDGFVEGTIRVGGVEVIPIASTVVDGDPVVAGSLEASTEAVVVRTNG
jgi:hypothetical protein